MKLKVSAGAYGILTSCCLLQGNKTFLLDLAGLQSHNRNDLIGTIKHVAAFKGEDGEKYHWLFMLSVTLSGLKCRVWMESWWNREPRKGGFEGHPSVEQMAGF
jgi:hypothetical protein